MTINRAAQEALDVQNACNLSGVVKAFDRATATLWEIAHRTPHLGTDWVNKHPISVLFSSKIESLTGSGEVNKFSKSYDECVRLAAMTEEGGGPLTEGLNG